jgi:hypothetical protein
LLAWLFGILHVCSSEVDGPRRRFVIFMAEQSACGNKELERFERGTQGLTDCKTPLSGFIVRGERRMKVFA